MSWFINPSDFINYAAFLANFSWISISFQLIFLKTTLFFSFSHDLFLSLAYTWHLVNTCLVNCIHRLNGYSVNSNLGNFLKCKNFLKLIISILICIIMALVALQKLLFNFNISYIGIEQIVWNFLPVFSLGRVSSYSSKVFAPMLA